MIKSFIGPDGALHLRNFGELENFEKNDFFNIKSLLVQKME